MRDSLDPYRVLDVSPTATQAEIAHAYRAQLRDHHPDTRDATSSRGADDRLQRVLVAYALLRDPVRRAEYDEAAARPFAPTGAGAVKIRVTQRSSSTTPGPASTSPLRAGPVRRHR